MRGEGSYKEVFIRTLSITKHDVWMDKCTIRLSKDYCTKMIATATRAPDTYRPEDECIHRSPGALQSSFSLAGDGPHTWYTGPE